ncbi:MAG: hypothetical protein PHX70_06085 [Clostridium sp.]|nr:hypothetical protein [Clostridium sp.]
MGYYSLSMIVGMAIAPVATIMIMNKYKFFVIAAASIFFTVMGILSVDKVDIKKTHNTHSNKKALSLDDFFEKKAVLPAFLCFLLVITLCGIMSYIMLYGKEINMNNV